MITGPLRSDSRLRRPASVSVERPARRRSIWRPVTVIHEQVGQAVADSASAGPRVRRPILARWSVSLHGPACSARRAHSCARIRRKRGGSLPWLVAGERCSHVARQHGQRSIASMRLDYPPWSRCDHRRIVTGGAATADADAGVASAVRRIEEQSPRVEASLSSAPMSGIGADRIRGRIRSALFSSSTGARTPLGDPAGDCSSIRRTPHWPRPRLRPRSPRLR